MSQTSRYRRCSALRASALKRSLIDSGRANRGPADQPKSAQSSVHACRARPRSSAICSSGLLTCDSAPSGKSVRSLACWSAMLARGGHEERVGDLVRRAGGVRVAWMLPEVGNIELNPLQPWMWPIPCGSHSRVAQQLPRFTCDGNFAGRCVRIRRLEWLAHSSNFVNG